MNAVIIKEPKNKFIDIEKIKALCSEQGMSFAELGRKIGLENRDLISRRLQNLYAFTADELVLVAKELGVSVNKLTV
jgi:transcriptional regulator with XRE-family HTH domain